MLGWCSPVLIKPKIILQRLWEDRLDWDDPVTQAVRKTWERCRWCGELPILRGHLIPRSCFPREVDGASMQLHKFCDTSESAYVRVVYLRGVDQDGLVHMSLIMAKTKVAPIKYLSMPGLELCGAVIVAELLSHMAKILNIPNKQVYAWSESVVVLSWLHSNPQCFKRFVGNQVSKILELAPSTCWRHVSSKDNPANCSSRGLFPSELVQHPSWWKGPGWLRTLQTNGLLLVS